MDESSLVDDWSRLAAAAAIGRRQLMSELAGLSGRIGRCMKSVRNQSQAEGWFHPVIDEIVAVFTNRSAAITAGTS